MQQSEASALNLSDSSFSLTKVSIIAFVLIFCVFPTIWLTQNISDATVKAQATWYWVFGLTALVITCLALILQLASTVTKNPMIRVIDVCYYEPVTLLFGKIKNSQSYLLNIIFTTFLSMIIFLTITVRKEAFIYAPTFQVIDIGPAGNAIAYAFFAIMESLIFVVWVPAQIYAITMRLTRNVMVSCAVTLVLSPTVFTIYHVARYGPGGAEFNIFGLVFVFAFNFISVLWLLLLRNAILEFVTHTSNNVSLYIATISYVSPILIVFIFGFILTLEVLMYFALFSGKNKSVGYSSS